MPITWNVCAGGTPTMPWPMPSKLLPAGGASTNGTLSCRTGSRSGAGQAGRGTRRGSRSSRERPGPPGRSSQSGGDTSCCAACRNSARPTSGIAWAALERASAKAAGRRSIDPTIAHAWPPDLPRRTDCFLWGATSRAEKARRKEGRLLAAHDRRPWQSRRSQPAQLGEQTREPSGVVTLQRPQVCASDLLGDAERGLVLPQLVGGVLGGVEVHRPGGAPRADAVQGGDADELQGRVRAAAQEGDGAVLVGEVHGQIGVEGDAVEQPERPPDLVAELLERVQAALELRVDEQRHLDLLLGLRFQLPNRRRRGLARPPAAQHPPGEPTRLAAPAREGAKLERLDELAQVAVVASEGGCFDGFHAPPMLDDAPQGCPAEKT